MAVNRYLKQLDSDKSDNTSWDNIRQKPAISNGFLHFLGLYWIRTFRRHPDLNRGITVLQTAALATWLCRHKINGAGERI